MIENEFLAKLTSLFIFYRWHPEVALRYLPLVSEIKKIKHCVAILEVGSNGLGIVPYLKRPVTGVDKDFHKPYHPMLKRITGDATNLPVEGSSYDIVICVDMLEHLEKKSREKAIMEMIRVAKNKVLIGVPCGKLAEEEDKFLEKEYQKKHGKKYHYLDSQVNYGLPQEQDIIEALENSSKKYKKKIGIETFGNENLKVHRFLMRGFMTSNLLTDFFFRKIMLFAIPILRRLNQEPTYRRFFYVTIYT